MDPRKQLRLISVIQVLLGLLFVLSTMFAVTTGASITREEAQIQLKQDIPFDVQWVFINHGVPYPWPFGKQWCIIGGVIAIVSLLSLVASVGAAHRMRDRLAGSSR